MKYQRCRTWKTQDIQAESPLSWCRMCGRELYRGMKQDGFCPVCRRQRQKKGVRAP